jgi:hypothetical protein
MPVSEKGHFNFASDRAAGLVLGTGVLYIQDGIVFGRSSAGTGMFTLHDSAGKRVLVVDAALNDGNHYFVEMTPIVKKRKVCSHGVPTSMSCLGYDARGDE